VPTPSRCIASIRAHTQCTATTRQHRGCLSRVAYPHLQLCHWVVTIMPIAMPNPNIPAGRSCPVSTLLTPSAATPQARCALHASNKRLVGCTCYSCYVLQLLSAPASAKDAKTCGAASIPLAQTQPTERYRGNIWHRSSRHTHSVQGALPPTSYHSNILQSTVVWCFTRACTAA
jgi:hypothetical protein